MTSLPDPRLIADEIDRHLIQDVAEVWFPRCLDPGGGYHENFLADWTPGPDDSRSLVFQSRMVWFTSQMIGRDDRFRGYCRHGLDYFESVLLGEDGIPKIVFRPNGDDLSTLRSSYSFAFTIFALANASKARGNERALEIAVRVFQHLERYHKDPNGRGYFEHTSLENVLAALSRRGESLNSLFKHQNPHLHLLEAFTDLYRVWPDDLLRLRLQEAIDFFTVDLFVAPGYLVDHVSSDGTRGNGSVNFGHDLEVTHLLITASSLIGGDQEPAIETARKLIDHALLNGWDSVAGGFWSGRSSEGEIRKVKVWWVQMEGMLGLAALYKLTREGRILDALEKQWHWIRDFQIDPLQHGVHGAVHPDGSFLGRGHKGNTWKAAYHDGRAFLAVPEILRNLI